MNNFAFVEIVSDEKIMNFIINCQYYNLYVICSIFRNIFHEYSDIHICLRNSVANLKYLFLMWTLLILFRILLPGAS